MSTKAIVHQPSAEVYEKLGQALRSGQLVAMPTETVYGLAGNVFDEHALARIFSAKERPAFDPLIVHVSPAMLEGGDSLERLSELELVDASALSPAAASNARALIGAFWPGPLTLVLPKKTKVPDLATSGLSTVGVRMPRHPVAQALIDAAGKPLAAPSANRFGRISPTTAAHVNAELGDTISHILDGGPCTVGLESSVVHIAPDGLVTLLRPGGVGLGELERALGGKVSFETHPYAKTKAQAAPGMLESHYAPSKGLELLPCPVTSLSDEQLQALAQRAQGLCLGVLLFKGDAKTVAQALASRLGGLQVRALALSRSGELEEAARNLFAHLRALDASEAALLVAEPVETRSGLGLAIADRLKRAAAPRS